MPFRKDRLYIALASPTGRGDQASCQADHLYWAFITGSKDDAKDFWSYSLKVSRTGSTAVCSETSTQASDDTLNERLFTRVLFPQTWPNDSLPTRRIVIRLLVAKILDEKSLERIIQEPSVPQRGDPHEPAPSLEWAQNVLSLLRQDIERGGTDGRPPALGASWHNLDWDIIRSTAIWFAGIMIPRLLPMRYGTFDLLELAAGPERS